MSKVKAKVITVAVGKQDEGVTEMFNQMIGAGSVNLTIAWPRYQRLKRLCEQLVKLFHQLSLSPPMAARRQERDEIAAWVKALQGKIAQIFRADLSDYAWNLSLVDAETHKKFGEIYEELKKSSVINEFILMCDGMVPYRKNFADIETLNHKFVHSMPGVEWYPFQFCSLNYKELFTSASLAEISLFMIVLHKAFVFTFEIYNEIQSPDIDIDTFVDVIVKNIDGLQKIPALSRCGDAFRKLKESVELLKNNFNSYYRDFVITKDSSIIMQHFVLDVGKTTGAGAKVAGQFRTIINYYRKMSNGRVEDPRLRSLLDKTCKQFEDTDRKTQNLGQVAPANTYSDTDSDEDPDSDLVYNIAMETSELEKSLQ